MVSSRYRAQSGDCEVDQFTKESGRDSTLKVKAMKLTNWDGKLIWRQGRAGIGQCSSIFLMCPIGLEEKLYQGYRLVMQ